jgi:cytochrome P450
LEPDTGRYQNRLNLIDAEGGALTAMAGPVDAWDAVASRFPHAGLVALLVTAIALGVATRLLSGQAAAPCKDGTWLASTPGYWVPFLGHVPQMAWDTDGYLSRMRERFPRGVFSLRLLGQVHTFVHRPSMAIMLMNKPQSVADEEWISEHLMMSNFGFSKADRALFRNAFHEIHANYKQLLAGPTLSRIVDATADNLKRSIADLITLNSYPSDQMEWERLAEADLVETPAGDKVVEANLNELIKNFVAKTASPALFGTDFVNNFPEFPQHIWAFDEAFVLLAMNLPIWVPWPPLHRARRERGKALACMREFHEAFDKFLDGEDPGARWCDMDNVSPLIRSRTETYRKHGISMAGRAACEFSLYWAMNANSAPLVFWMVLEICRDPVLLAEVREEIAPHVVGVQPRNDFGLGVWLAPRLERLDVEALLTQCPLFKSTYVETMRLYTGVWSIKWIQEDTTLKESGRGGESFLLRKGTYAHAPQEVHQLDPRFFPDPNEWRGGRHVKETVDEKGKKVLTAELGTIRPYGESHGGDDGATS